MLIKFHLHHWGPETDGSNSGITSNKSCKLRFTLHHLGFKWMSIIVALIHKLSSNSGIGPQMVVLNQWHFVDIIVKKRSYLSLTYILDVQKWMVLIVAVIHRWCSNSGIDPQMVVLKHWHFVDIIVKRDSSWVSPTSLMSCISLRTKSNGSNSGSYT